MNTPPVILERLLRASAAQVWKAITDKDEMKKWYFDLEDFRAEVGFRFSFTGCDEEEVPYLHLCEVTEVVPERKLTYTWVYDGYDGLSHVSFELEPKGEEQTLLRLMHTGLESFPSSIPSFRRHNFVEGWNDILNNSLGAYLDGLKDYRKTITVDKTAEEVYRALTTGITAWWTDKMEGKAEREGDIFTVCFTHTFMTLQVEKLVPGKRILWRCLDNYQDMAWINNKKEWIGTVMIWNILEEAGKTSVTLVHNGLNELLECNTTCEQGWDFFFAGSLFSFLQEGKGKPYIHPV